MDTINTFLEFRNDCPLCQKALKPKLIKFVKAWPDSAKYKSFEATFTHLSFEENIGKYIRQYHIDRHTNQFTVDFLKTASKKPLNEILINSIKTFKEEQALTQISIYGEALYLINKCFHCNCYQYKSNKLIFDFPSSTLLFIKPEIESYYFLKSHSDKSYKIYRVENLLKEQQTKISLGQITGPVRKKLNFININNHINRSFTIPYSTAYGFEKSQDIMQKLDILDFYNL